MIAIIAVLCSLSAPANCHEQTVTTSDFADVSMQSCLMGAPQLADWMNHHPTERLAAWRLAKGTAGELRQARLKVAMLRAIFWAKPYMSHLESRRLELREDFL
jgi:hypothetical protein